MNRLTVPALFPTKCKKACIMSNTPEPLKTHLQLNVGKLGNFDALQCGNRGLLEEQRHLQDDSKCDHSRR